MKNICEKILLRLSEETKINWEVVAAAAAAAVTADAAADAAADVSAAKNTKVLLTSKKPTSE